MDVTAFLIYSSIVFGMKKASLLLCTKSKDAFVLYDL